MKITIDVESMGNDTIKANFKGGAKNFDELMSLGGALLQTFLNSAGEIIKRNDDELNMPDEILHLTILDALVDKVCDLIKVSADDLENETKADEFLNNIIKGMKGDED